MFARLCRGRPVDPPPLSAARESANGILDISMVISFVIAWTLPDLAEQPPIYDYKTLVHVLMGIEIAALSVFGSSIVLRLLNTYCCRYHDDDELEEIENQREDQPLLLNPRI